MLNKTFNTHDELVAAAPENKTFAVKVNSDPLGNGGEQILKARIVEGYLDTYFEGQEDINGIDYEWTKTWKEHYTGTFTLIDEEDEEIFFITREEVKDYFNSLGLPTSNEENQTVAKNATVQPCDCQFKKPEIYKVGDTVLITEEARKCGDYQRWYDYQKDCIGKRMKIVQVEDGVRGVYYTVATIKGNLFFPSYCVKRIDQPKKKITVELTEEQIEKIKEMGIEI